jgi:hypothetical protein
VWDLGGLAVSPVSSGCVLEGDTMKIKSKMRAGFSGDIGANGSSAAASAAIAVLVLAGAAFLPSCGGKPAANCDKNTQMEVIHNGGPSDGDTCVAFPTACGTGQDVTCFDQSACDAALAQLCGSGYAINGCGGSNPPSPPPNDIVPFVNCVTM